MKTAPQILKEAKSLISDPKNWTQFVYARSRDDADVPTDSSLACKFCALGAVLKVTADNPEGWHRSVAFLQQSISAKDNSDIHEFNDCRSHTAVMQMFDRAILLAKQAEARAERKS